MPRVTNTLDYGAAGDYRTFYVYYDETYNAATNTSDIKVTVIDFGTLTDGRPYGKLYINDTLVLTLQYETPSDLTSSWYVVDCPAVTVPHNADGTGSFQMKFRQLASGWTNFYVEWAGQKYTVESWNDTKTAQLTTHPRNYTLTATSGTGANLSVTRGGVALSNGAQIAYGDVLNVTAWADAGYTLTSNPSGTYTVQGDVKLQAAAALNTYTLNFSASAGAGIRVIRNGVELASGATITHGEWLQVEAWAGTGYHLTSNPSGIYVVDGGKTFAAAAALNQYTLSGSQGAHTRIYINRTSSPYAGANTGLLAFDTPIYYGDTLAVTVDCDPGWHLTQNPSQAITVSNNVTLNSAAELNVYVLRIYAGVGSSIAVTRNGTKLSDGDRITYGETLVIAASENAGYHLTENPSGTFTVYGDTSAVSRAEVNAYTLSVTQGQHIAGTVNRISSSLKGAATGTVTSGATIYHGDVLQLAVSVDEGYQAKAITINGKATTSGATHTVAGDTAVVLSADVMAVLRISDDTGYELYQIMISDASAYGLYQAHLSDGTSWKPLS